MGATSSRPSDAHRSSSQTSSSLPRPDQRRTSSELPLNRRRNSTSTSRPVIHANSSRLPSFGTGRPTRPSLLKRKSSDAQGKRDRESRRFSLQNVLSGQRRGGSGAGMERDDAGDKDEQKGKGYERESGEAGGGERSRAEERELVLDRDTIAPLPSTSEVPAGLKRPTAADGASEQNLTPPTGLTPSLPTSPGPPVLHRASVRQSDTDDQHMGTSYFEPDALNRPARTISTPGRRRSCHNDDQNAGPSGTVSSRPPEPRLTHRFPGAPVASNNPPTSSDESAVPPTRTRPSRARGLSLPITPFTNQRTVTGRLSAMLGFSAPGAPELLDSTPATAAQTPAVTPTSTTFPIGSSVAQASGSLRPAMAPMTPMTPIASMLPAAGASSEPLAETVRARGPSPSGGRKIGIGGSEGDGDDAAAVGLGPAGIDHNEGTDASALPDTIGASTTVHPIPATSDTASNEADAAASTRTEMVPSIPNNTGLNFDDDSNGSNDPNDPRIAELRRELDEIGSEVDRVTRQIEDLNARRRELERQPVGAMLVIQGLAQTQVQTNDEDGEEQAATTGDSGSSRQAASTATGQGSSGAGVAASPGGRSAATAATRAGTPSTAVPRRPTTLRRMSDGSLFRRRREQQEDHGASLDQQARMIGGLLTVAAAATANTLLQPPARPAPPARSGVGGAIDNLINRLRPNRSPRRGIEQALGSYLRNAARDGRRAELTGERNRPSAAATAAAAVATAGGASAPTGTHGGAEGEGTEAEARPELGSDFQQFLEDLQNDLVGAVRAYAAHPQDEEDDADSFMTASSALHNTVSSRRDLSSRSMLPVSSTTSSNSAMPDITDGAGDTAHQTSESTAAATSGAQSFSADPSIPTYHRQLGQNLPTSTGLTGSGTDTNRYGVTGGSGTGQARSLNFFRAHLFPPSAAEAERQRQRRANLAEGEEDVDDTIVPCIFVGVRSMQGAEDIGDSAEELAQSPGFPFGEGAMTPGGTRPATQGDASGAGSAGNARERTSRSRAASLGGRSTPDVPRTPNTPANGREEGSYFDPMPPNSATSGQSGRPATPVHSADSHPHSRPSMPRMSSGPARTFRDRVLARLNRRPPPERPMNTYLVYVVGGNYPRNHPVLRIPALLTGGVLTDEDMTLIGELLGPAKPPTASKDDIAKSGLRIVDGAEIAELGQKGEVHENTVDRCLVCLGDYEEGETCRVLGCKHVYHQECVDRWLEQGANSCPACRNQAVEKTSQTAHTAPASAPALSTSSTRPSLSRAASALSATPPPISPAIPIPRSNTHAQASGLLNPDRPLSVVPESEGSSQAPSPVPSLTAPIDVGSVGAHLASDSGAGSASELVPGEVMHAAAGQPEDKPDDVN